jgi:hypothetical protein
MEHTSENKRNINGKPTETTNGTYIEKRTEQHWKTNRKYIEIKGIQQTSNGTCIGKRTELQRNKNGKYIKKRTESKRQPTKHTLEKSRKIIGNPEENSSESTDINRQPMEFTSKTN